VISTPARSQETVIGRFDQLLTVKEVADKLRMTPEWVRAHASGKTRPRLNSVRLGHYVRFLERDVVAFVDACRLVHQSVMKRRDTNSRLAA